MQCNAAEKFKGRGGTKGLVIPNIWNLNKNEMSNLIHEYASLNGRRVPDYGVSKYFIKVKELSLIWASFKG